MHLLFEGSEESPGARGIGILKGRVVRLRTRQRLPHIGWNSIRIRKECPLFRGVNGEFMYFVHSYHPRPEENITVATARYGCVVTAGICSGNVYGTQFHPEKSGEAGLRVLKNFLEL
jgi:glutamine amidotransferase